MTSMFSMSQFSRTDERCRVYVADSHASSLKRFSHVSDSISPSFELLTIWYGPSHQLRHIGFTTRVSQNELTNLIFIVALVTIVLNNSAVLSFVLLLVYLSFQHCEVVDALYDFLRVSSFLLEMPGTSWNNTTSRGVRG